jgi:hypothetical protein
MLGEYSNLLRWSRSRGMSCYWIGKWVNFESIAIFSYSRESPILYFSLIAFSLFHLAVDGRLWNYGFKAALLLSFGP